MIMHVTTKLQTPMLTYPEVDVALAARHDQHGLHLAPGLGDARVTRRRESAMT